MSGKCVRLSVRVCLCSLMIWTRSIKLKTAWAPGTTVLSAVYSSVMTTLPLTLSSESGGGGNESAGCRQICTKGPTWGSLRRILLAPSHATFHGDAGFFCQGKLHYQQARVTLLRWCLKCQLSQWKCTPGRQLTALFFDVIFYHTFVSSSNYSCSRAFQYFSKPVPAFKKALFLRCTFHHTTLFLLLKHSTVALETLLKSCSSPSLVPYTSCSYKSSPSHA